MSAPNNPYDPVAVSTLEPEAIDAMVAAALEAIDGAGDLESLKAVRLAHSGDRSPLSLANREIGHVHGDSLVDVPFGRIGQTQDIAPATVFRASADEMEHG